MCFVVGLTVMAASIAPAVAPANSEIPGLIFWFLCLWCFKGNDVTDIGMLESCNLDIVVPNHECSLAAADILGVRVTLDRRIFCFQFIPLWGRGICTVAKDNRPKKANWRSSFRQFNYSTMSTFIDNKLNCYDRIHWSGSSVPVQCRYIPASWLPAGAPGTKRPRGLPLMLTRLVPSAKHCPFVHNNPVLTVRYIDLDGKSMHVSAMFFSAHRRVCKAHESSETRSLEKSTSNLPY